MQKKLSKEPRAIKIIFLLLLQSFLVCKSKGRVVLHYEATSVVNLTYAQRFVFSAEKKSSANHLEFQGKLCFKMWICRFTDPKHEGSGALWLIYSWSYLLHFLEKQVLNLNQDFLYNPIRVRTRFFSAWLLKGVLFPPWGQLVTTVLLNKMKLILMPRVNLSIAYT